MRRKVPAGRDLREIPQARARPTAKPLEHFARKHAERDDAIAAAYASGGYSMQDIGDYFRLHYSRAGKIVRAASQTKSKAKGKTP